CRPREGNRRSCMLVRRLRHAAARAALVGSVSIVESLPVVGGAAIVASPASVARPTPAPASPLHVRVGPGQRPGKRQVDRPPRAARPPARRAPERTHKTGKPPKVPRATLPEDAPKLVINERRRRSIAGGATADDLDQGNDDPDLLELARAERQLFPEAFGGSDDLGLPRPLGHAHAPYVSTSGLPLGDAPVQAPRARATEPWLHALELPNIPVPLEQRTLDFVKFYRDS